MTNLIIDINNILYRSLFSLGGYGSNSYTFDTQREVDQLMRKISMDITYIIRQTNPNRVIFCVDSKSWRKDIHIEENEGYKANREKASHVNWTNVFATLNEIQEILKSNGYIVSTIDKAEADDLICLWTNELLYNKREHVIIVSSDEDVRQLVKSYWKDDNKKVEFNVFSTVFNPISTGKNSTKKLYVSKEFNEWINKEDDNNDIFNFSKCDVEKDDYKKIINESKATIEIVNGDLIGLNKIFCGDDGDNIPSFYTWLNDKEKEKRITPSISNKIIEKLNLSDYLDISDKTEELKQILIESSKKDSITIDVDKRLKRQISLVILNRECFPVDIINKFDEELNKQLETKRVHNNDITMQVLLEGTRYVSDSYKEANIFKEIDRISNKLF